MQLLRKAGYALALAASILPQGALAQAEQPFCTPALFAKYPMPRPFGPALGAPTCRPYLIDTPNAQLILGVAANPADRARGLMYVQSLAQFVGMLFAFPEETAQSFWMKDTLIPLDMVFVDGTGRITAIFENVPSSTLETPDAKVATRRGTGKYVIELRAGDAKRAGLRPGIRLSLPKIEGVT